MSGYLVNTPNGYKDLNEIFEPYSGGTKQKTGFQIPSGQDLADIFAPLGTDAPLIYDTNILALNGQDLSQVFLPIRPSVTITVPPDNYYYTYKTTDGYTVVIFADYTSPATPTTPTTNIGYNSVTGIKVVFNNFINNTVYVTTVGGGGGGGNGITYNTNLGQTKSRGGGGGGGGGVSTTVAFFPTTTGQPYSINVGGGGVAQNAGAPSSMNYVGTPFPFTIVSSTGGNPGTDATTSADGTGGTGGTGTVGFITFLGCQGGNGGTSTKPSSSSDNQGTSGQSKNTYTIYPNTSYYFGGGGGGGYASVFATTVPAGGLGGGGSSNAGTNGNGGVAYTGPTSIYYNVGGVVLNGYPGVGGGGAGGNANASTSGSQVGGQGGSGVVILCYKTVNP